MNAPEHVSPLAGVPRKHPEVINRRPLSLSRLYSSLVLFYEEAGRLYCSVIKAKTLYNPTVEGLRELALGLIATDPSIHVTERGDPWSRAMALLDWECRRGRDLHGIYRNHFQAWAVIREELDEFWMSVHANKPDPDEIVQVAATSIRVLLEIENRDEKETMGEVRGYADSGLGYQTIPEFTSFMDFYAHLTRCLDEYRAGVYGSHHGGQVLTQPLMDIAAYCIRALVCGVGTPVPLE